MIFCCLVLVALGLPAARPAEPINLLVVNEINNSAALNAFKAVETYLSSAKIPGLRLGKVGRVELDSTQKYLTVDDVCSAYDQSIAGGAPPHVVLDFTTGGLSSKVMKIMSRNLGLPTVSGSMSDNINEKKPPSKTAEVEQQKYIINVMSPNDIIPQLIYKVAQQLTMINAAVLFDESFEMDIQYKELFKNSSVRHLIAKVQLSDLSGQLNNLVNLNLVNFFVLAKTVNIDQVLAAAERSNYFGKKYSWCLITKEKKDIFVQAGNASVIFAYPSLSPYVSGNTISKKVPLPDTNQIEFGYYFDLTLRSMEAVKSLMDAQEWPSNMTYAPCSSANFEPIIRSDIDLRRAMIAVNSPAVYAPILISAKGKSYPEIEMKIDQLNLKSKRLESRTNIGVWKAGVPGEIVYAADKSLTPFRAISVYRVATVIQPPFVMKRTVNGTVEYYGYCIDLLEDIKNILGFEYTIYETPDGVYGNMDENMNWNGMIKELIDKNAEIGLGALAVMAERENVIDFTVPYYDLVGITIMMSMPTVSTSLFKFLTVLENDVWLCILAAYFFTSILLWIFDRWSPYSYQNNKEQYLDDPEEEKREFSLKESLWFCMTSLTPQGGGETPKHLSGRLIAATWWLFGFIIIASYTANLAAFLTVSRLESPVNSLDDLATQYKIQYAPLNGSDTMTYFQRMAYIEQRFYEIWKDMSLNDSMTEVERSKLAVWDYPVSDKHTKIWQSMQEAGLPLTFEEAIQRVRQSGSTNDGFAFIGDATDIRYQVMISCDLQMVGEDFSRKPYAVAVQNGSPLRDQLNDAILRLLNQRRLETLKERWWTDNPEKKVCVDQNSQSDGISIQNIGGVFIVIFVGITLACITLAVEYCWYRCYRTPVPVVADTSTTAAKRTMNEIYKNGKNQPFILDPSKNRERFNNEYGYYGGKNESGSDGPRARKAW